MSLRIRKLNMRKKMVELNISKTRQRCTSIDPPVVGLIGYYKPLYADIPFYVPQGILGIYSLIAD